MLNCELGGFHAINQIYFLYKKENINDIKILVKTANKKLKELLAELDFTDMKKDVRTLL